MLTLLAATLLAPAAASAEGTGIGALRCVITAASPGHGLPEAMLACSFEPAAGAAQDYRVRVLGIGEGVQVGEDAVFVWDVMASGPARGAREPHRGTYLAGSETVELENGITARELIAAGAPGMVLRPAQFSGLSGDLTGLRIQSLAIE
ncbi:DUF992 domain-containing protein [Limibaculum sp. M0105]|uniref:DUF992 domain-containing protein n=1 Tax=Thermohalobaculum xanthum TaxID=2753746 RepID=A0A8J7SIM4_9RHOB|nr:DUF992 domain-containing protein [Thermohalobaculum xanthum]MBK0400430.1 DUF992 domain-containing protein [Thermohalobaculum xanthum]